MLKKVLVTGLIRDGDLLLQGLEQQSFPISAALWYYLPEAERWRLVIASQFVDSQGPMAAYMLVQRVLATLERPTLLLSDVSVVSPHGADFQDLCLDEIVLRDTPDVQAQLDEATADKEKAEARLVEITGKVFKFLERYDYFNSLDGVEDPTPQEELEELRESLPSDMQALVERHKAGEEAVALLSDPRLHSTWTIDHVNGEGWRVNDLNTGHSTGWLPTLLDALRAMAKGNKP